MRRKPSHQSKRKLSKGKRRPVPVKSFAKKALPKFSSRGTVGDGDGRPLRPSAKAKAC